MQPSHVLQCWGTFLGRKVNAQQVFDSACVCCEQDLLSNGQSVGSETLARLVHLLKDDEQVWKALQLIKSAHKVGNYSCHSSHICMARCTHPDAWVSLHVICFVPTCDILGMMMKDIKSITCQVCFDH